MLLDPTTENNLPAYINGFFSTRLIVGTIDEEKEKWLAEQARRTAEIEKILSLLPVETSEDKEAFERTKKRFLTMTTEEYETEIVKLQEAIPQMITERAEAKKRAAKPQQKKKHQSKLSTQSLFV